MHISTTITIELPVEATVLERNGNFVLSNLQIGRGLFYEAIGINVLPEMREQFRETVIKTLFAACKQQPAAFGPPIEADEEDTYRRISK